MQSTSCMAVENLDFVHREESQDFLYSSPSSPIRHQLNQINILKSEFSFTQNICSHQKGFFYVAHLDVRDFSNYSSDQEECKWSRLVLESWAGKAGFVSVGLGPVFLLILCPSVRLNPWNSEEAQFEICNTWKHFILRPGKKEEESHLFA